MWNMLIIPQKKYNRANIKDLQEIFEKYASVEKNGQKFISHEVFMTKFLKMFPNTNYNNRSMNLLAGVVSVSKETKTKKLISFEDFYEFEGLLCDPDALYLTAFKLFDETGSGKITYDVFKKVIKRTELNKYIGFNNNNKLLNLYFGSQKQNSINYYEFRQLLHDNRRENILQAFKKYEVNGEGYIYVNDFYFLMVNFNKHLLTADIESRIKQIVGDKRSKCITFPYYVAFDSLLNNMEVIMGIYLQITNGRKNVEITKDEFMNTALLYSPITPLQIDILYEICDEKSTGTISYKNINAIAPNVYMSNNIENGAEIYYCGGPEQRTFFTQILENTYRFLVGSIAGACGIFVVYPIDLVKTRLQSQRNDARLYKNAMDCFTKVVKNEGFLGLYSGLVPQVVGNAWSQALKLVLNDFARDKLMEKDGSITLLSEIIAGCVSGAGQVLALNPIELIKIRMQVAGESKGQETKSVFTIIRQLGPIGLYKGGLACIIRDLPFCAIYFPLYSNTKILLADENGYNSKWNLVLAGALAGIPSAFLVTPADVVKTRLQVAERAGRSNYTGIVDACKKIYKEEGGWAFWKGSAALCIVMLKSKPEGEFIFIGEFLLARVLRIAPAMAITVGVYEIIQRYFWIDFGGSRPPGSEVKPKKTNYERVIETNPDHIGGYKAANTVFTGLESRFGLALPKFRVTKFVNPDDK